MAATAGDLLLMPDYSADPVWDAMTGDMVSLDSLPVSAKTKKLLRAWATRWDELATQDLEADHGYTPGLAQQVVPREAWAEHRREGRLVWRELQHDLGDAWRLGWVSSLGGRRHVQWEPDGPVELRLPGQS